MTLAVAEALNPIKPKPIHIETVYVNLLDPSRGCTLLAELIVTTSLEPRGSDRTGCRQGGKLTFGNIFCPFNNIKCQVSGSGAGTMGPTQAIHPPLLKKSRFTPSLVLPSSLVQAFGWTPKPFRFGSHSLMVPTFPIVRRHWWQVIVPR